MSKMVSARIPDAVYEQARTRLKEIGSNTSELIGAAFEYILQKDALPSARNNDMPERRTLSTSEKVSLQNDLQRCVLNISISSDIKADKQTARKARAARYEALD